MIWEPINPLLIDLVIQKVMSFLPEKDIKACRLVCYKWLSPATRALQKAEKPITFGDLYKVNLIRLRPDLDTIKLFMTTMQGTDVQPYVKFDLRPSIFAPNCLPLLEDFLYDFGPVIESLLVSLAYESSDRFNSHCFPKMDLRRLKSLDFCNTIRGEMRPSLWTDLLTTRYNLLESILTAAPNLEKLSLWCDRENTAWPGDAIEVLRKADLPNLTSLKISFPMTNFQMVNLSRLQVQLTSFTFLIREPFFNTESFLKVLESQRATLENLKLVDMQCDQQKVLELPQLPILKSLEIEGTFYGDNSTLTLLNFHFKRLPLLEKVILRNCYSNNFDIESFLDLGGSCRTLKEFHVTLAHDFLNLKRIRNLGTSFPNLENLHVMFSSESKNLLTEVFDNLKELKHLTINVRKCGDNLDHILTGVKVLEWDTELLPEISGIFGSAMEASHIKVKPSLRELTDLRSLELKGEHRNYKKETRAITEITAYLAFLQMEGLRKIMLWNTGKNLSETCLQQLGERIDVIQIYPEDA